MKKKVDNQPNNFVPKNNDASRLLQKSINPERVRQPFALTSEHISPSSMIIEPQIHRDIDRRRSKDAAGPD